MHCFPFRQANVSSVYRAKPTPVPQITDKVNNPDKSSISEEKPSTSAAPAKVRGQTNTFNPLDMLRKAKSAPNPNTTKEDTLELNREDTATLNTAKEETLSMEIDQSDPHPNTDASSSQKQEKLERRLKIEEEVTFVSKLPHFPYHYYDNTKVYVCCRHNYYL